MYVPDRPDPLESRVGRREIRRRSKQLDSKLSESLRPDLHDLEARGYVPDNYMGWVEDKDKVKLDVAQSKENARKSLIMSLNQRPPREELTQRGLVNPAYFEHDTAEEAQKALKEERDGVATVLDEKIGNRPSQKHVDRKYGVCLSFSFPFF